MLRSEAAEVAPQDLPEAYRKVLDMNLWFDLRYAWRLTSKSWGYSLMCAAVVALSVGLTLWTYAVAYNQLWKPLPFPGAERWYSVQMAAKAGAAAQPSIDAYTYQEMLKSSGSADYLGAFSNRALILSAGEASVNLRGASITPRLLSATQVPPLLGRYFEESDGKSQATQVAILSYDTWRNYFAGDPGIIGKTAQIDSAPAQIVGVMPKDFYAFQDTEVWLPLQMLPVARPKDSSTTFYPFIALTNGQKPDALLSEMKNAVNSVNGEYPDLFNAARHPDLIPVNQLWTHGETPILATFGFVALAVFLLGCMNIAMIFLARMLERGRELALRTALGAWRGRLMRQCLIETALVVFVGLVGGYWLAAMGMAWAQGLSDLSSQVLAYGRAANQFELRLFDLMIAIVFAIVLWLVSTLIPARRISRQDAAAVLAGSGKGTALRGSGKSAGFLVGLQVLVSCVVLVLCGSVVLANREELSKPTGLDTAQVMISAEPTTFDSKFTEPAQRLRYWEDLSASIKSQMPDAEVAYTTAIPTKPIKVPVAVENQEGSARGGRLTLPTAVVSEDYFKLFGLKLRSGRLFDSTDNSSSLPVAIIDEQTAAQYWPNQDVLGKRVQLNPSDNGQWLTIVGVVSGVKGEAYTNNPGVIYQPLRQVAPQSFELIVKSRDFSGDPRVALRAAAYAVDRALPLRNLQMLDDYLVALNLMYSSMVSVLIAVAIITGVLAVSGLVGLISRSVAQRTQEVGIRRALGATPLRATSMFMRQGAIYLCVAIVGVAIGIIAANLMSAVVPNVLGHALPVSLGVIALMAAVIFTASYLPSRRAVALELGDALRYE
ncbi:MAG: ABC transporter permease [Terracidiphilus sp.]|jgi:predicted permease